MHIYEISKIDRPKSIPGPSFPSPDPSPAHHCGSCPHWPTRPLPFGLRKSAEAQTVERQRRAKPGTRERTDSAGGGATDSRLSPTPTRVGPGLPPHEGCGLRGSGTRPRGGIRCQQLGDRLAEALPRWAVASSRAWHTGTVAQQHRPQGPGQQPAS